MACANASSSTTKVTPGFRASVFPTRQDDVRRIGLADPAQADAFLLGSA
jgi:hypothetical protein